MDYIDSRNGLFSSSNVTGEKQGSEMTATIVASSDQSAQYLQFLSALHR